MSGDVQPRKRKDKKRKKDELGVEEPRGTAAALGEGDVFMHSQHDHGTGGHWCAKIIFFSLLAVLIGLVGLIILENRGLSELEANSVESRYSGVLEGWLEDAPDDDHHDEHTLDLKHHDDEVSNADDHGDDNGPDDEEHGDDNEHSDDEDEDNGEDDEDEHDDDQDNEDSEEQDLEQADDEEDRRFSYSKYFGGGDDDGQEDDDQDTEDEQEAGDNDEDDENDDNLGNDVDDDQDDDDNDDDENETNADDEDINDDDDDNESAERNDDEDDNENDFDDEQDHLETLLRDNEDEEEHEEQEEDEEIEVEKIEKEVSEEEEPISLELPTLPETDDDDDDDEKETSNEDAAPEDDGDDEEDDFLEADEEPRVVERITAPAGKPFVEVEEDEVSSEIPDTLEEEEEYEKQQEELRREKEQASHMWLKLVVGGALLVATHAVVRRATAPRDVSESEEQVREDTPVTDRRMTLIPEEPAVDPKRLYPESFKPLAEEAVKNIPSFGKSAQIPRQESEEDEDQEEPDEDEEEIEEPKKEVEKESYSDEEVEDDEEEVFEQREEKPKPSPVEKKSPVDKKLPEPEQDLPDDVEIIDDDQLEEEEEDDEEDISDVDDVELLTRLEAKYGRLPEPERPGQKYKDGGNSLEDEWPGEPSDSFWRQQLDSAEQDLRQGAWLRAAERAGAPELRDSARARYLAAVALDRAAEAARDNQLLTRAIAAYLHLLKMNERLSDKYLLEVANRTLDRIQFRGNYLGAEPVYRLLIRRFPDDPEHRNNLSVSFLMANRADLAEEVLKETLHRWPDNRIALAHHAFILKTKHNRLEEAVKAFQMALEGDEGAACEPRFYYHFGDALLLLGRFNEAHEVHKRAAELGHFLSPSQRSLYNVPRLKSRPWWNVEDTPYVKLARALEESWRDILKEGEAAKALYEQEKEGLRERGEWSQLDLFVRGREVPERCSRAPVTCAAVRAEPAAAGCRRGQVKFSAMQPGTHVRAHVGPTNCRLRMHLALSNTTGTYIRVDQETRQWHEGKVLMFDDSFEHEVWHNGTGARLVLIVDVWHPGLTPAERRQLPAI